MLDISKHSVKANHIHHVTSYQGQHHGSCICMSHPIKVKMAPILKYGATYHAFKATVLVSHRLSRPS